MVPLSAGDTSKSGCFVHLHQGVQCLQRTVCRAKSYTESIPLQIRNDENIVLHCKLGYQINWRYRIQQQLNIERTFELMMFCLVLTVLDINSRTVVLVPVRYSRSSRQLKLNICKLLCVKIECGLYFRLRDRNISSRVRIFTVSPPLICSSGTSYNRRGRLSPRHNGERVFERSR